MSTETYPFVTSRAEVVSFLACRTATETEIIRAREDYANEGRRYV